MLGGIWGCGSGRGVVGCVRGCVNSIGPWSDTWRHPEIPDDNRGYVRLVAVGVVKNVYVLL